MASPALWRNCSGDWVRACIVAMMYPRHGRSSPMLILNRSSGDDAGNVLGVTRHDLRGFAFNCSPTLQVTDARNLRDCRSLRAHSVPSFETPAN
jgi:hypothetical protein